MTTALLPAANARCGWIDLVALRYAIMLNGVTQLIMMKSGVL